MNLFSRLFKKTSPKNEENNTKLCSKQELICKAFPLELQSDVNVVCQALYKTCYYDSTTEIFDLYTEFYTNNLLVQIPYRIYYNKMNYSKFKSFTDTQKTILYCLLTRSDNGYIREKCARLLLGTNYPSWAIPFIVNLCGDYVLEIVTALYEMLKDTDTTAIKQFCQTNKNVVRRCYDRMLSIWYTYDRYSAPDFYEYVGRKLFHECLGYSRKLKKRKKYMEQIELERTKNLSLLLNKKQ